ncbi:hypothetical protein [Limosilactobacillus ingluviei]
MHVEDAYFQEKRLRIGETLTLKLSAHIPPFNSRTPGEFVRDNYIYSEVGQLFFSLENNIRRLKSVTLIYSDDDTVESVDDINAFCRSLKCEKLHQKSRKGSLRFKLNCDLYFISADMRKIKNYLVFVDGAKKGYDLFVLQTFQTPLGKYRENYSIGNNKKITDYNIQTPVKFETKKHKIANRIIKLNELDKMLEPFTVNNYKIEPGEETESFKSFIESFRSAYNLRVVDINPSKK